MSHAQEVVNYLMWKTFGYLVVPMPKRLIKRFDTFGNCTH